MCPKLLRNKLHDELVYECVLEQCKTICTLSDLSSRTHIRLGNSSDLSLVLKSDDEELMLPNLSIEGELFLQCTELHSQL